MLGWAEGLNFCEMRRMAGLKTKNKQEWRVYKVLFNKNKKVKRMARKI